eukprot:SAG31_NODE_25_length_33055_cov_11.407919_4_plen_225_part_00
MPRCTHLKVCTMSLLALASVSDGQKTRIPLHSTYQVIKRVFNPPMHRKWGTYMFFWSVAGDLEPGSTSISNRTHSSLENATHNVSKNFCPWELSKDFVGDRSWVAPVQSEPVANMLPFQLPENQNFVQEMWSACDEKCIVRHMHVSDCRLVVPSVQEKINLRFGLQSNIENCDRRRYRSCPVPINSTLAVRTPARLSAAIGSLRCACLTSRNALVAHMLTVLST